MKLKKKSQTKKLTTEKKIEKRMGIKYDHS
jgi:hypothetical protein